VAVAVAAEGLTLLALSNILFNVTDKEIAELGGQLHKSILGRERRSIFFVHIRLHDHSFVVLNLLTALFPVCYH
jgi:hypothetical protein